MGDVLAAAQARDETATTESNPEPGAALTATQLMADYAPRVYRWAESVSRSNQDAEDLAHDALLRAVRQLDRFDPARASLQTWLWRLVISAAQDAGRVRRRHIALMDRLLRLEVDEVETVECAALARLDDAALLEVIRSLAPRHRELIALRFDADLDYAGMAAVMGMREDAVRRATARAVAALRKTLEAPNAG